MRSCSNPRQGAICVSRARIGAIFEKERHDLLLLVVRTLRAARARRARADVERCRALPAVSRVHTSAPLEETADSLGAPRANRVMQRNRSGLVLVLDVRPRVEEELNHRPLFGRVPHPFRPGPGIARVMESGCSTPVLGVRISSRLDQRADGERPERRCREVEGCIAGVDLVRDGLHEALVGSARLRDLRRSLDEPRSRGVVREDGSKELDKGR